jgi:hypothetical protein
VLCLQVVHPSVEELTDIAANCFQVRDTARHPHLLVCYSNAQVYYHRQSHKQHNTWQMAVAANA